MSPKQSAAQIAKTGPPKRRRASHGQWVAPAQAVYELVHTHQWNVSDAVRQVVEQHNFKPKGQAFNGVRAAYYVLRNRREGVFEV